MNWSIFTDLAKLVSDGFNHVIALISKGKLDVTEIEKIKLDLAKIEMQMGLAFTQAHLAFMLAGKYWHTPLVLASGLFVILIPVNNIVVKTYFAWAKPIDLMSVDYGVLLGVFLALAFGDLTLIKKVVGVALKGWGDRKAKKS